jgi:HSP20 family protein
MLMRSDPFRDLDRLAGQLWGNGGNGGRTPAMPLDAYRRGEQFIIHVDVPGIEPSSIDLTVDKNVLTVTGERTWQRDENMEVVATERPHGQFSRQLFLGDGLDTERIQASCEHGVLTVRIPVAEHAKPRRVEIASDASGKQVLESSSA